MNIQGYRVLDGLCRGPSHVLLRGSRVADDAPVLLKGRQRQPPLPSQAADLRREFAWLGELSAPGLPRAHELARGGGSCGLVLEDPPGAPEHPPHPPEKAGDRAGTQLLEFLQADRRAVVEATSALVAELIKGGAA